MYYIYLYVYNSLNVHIGCELIDGRNKSRIQGHCWLGWTWLRIATPDYNIIQLGLSLEWFGGLSAGAGSEMALTAIRAINWRWLPVFISAGNDVWFEPRHVATDMLIYGCDWVTDVEVGCRAGSTPPRRIGGMERFLFVGLTRSLVVDFGSIRAVYQWLDELYRRCFNCRTWSMEYVEFGGRGMLKQLQHLWASLSIPEHL